MEHSSAIKSDQPCASIDDVDRHFGRLKYMNLERARFLREFIRSHDLEDLLELGFFHGKSTAFMAAILEERGRGHVTTMDLESARNRKPSIEDVISTLRLGHRVTPVYAHRSFTWELRRLLARSPRPSFDFCYIDGAHTWDGTGFAFLLVDLLLKPGGWVIFDDLDWSIAKSPAARKNMQRYAGYSDEEKNARQVREVWEILVPARGYENRHEERRFGWGIAQKAVGA
ncbi:MAG TPA: class I SAM-dependent methyltransferase [Pseudomonadales bacterium]